LIFLLIASSCSSRKNRVNHSNIIPEKIFTTILGDLYLTDGMLPIQKITELYSPPDTLAAYLDVLNKYGYTMEDMDKTLMYYYKKKPKELIEIYDQVLASLSEMQSLYDLEVAQIQPRTGNLWEGESLYLLPEVSDKDSANFVFNAKGKGTYYLTFTATLSAVDVSYRPAPVIYSCHPDSIMTGKRYYIKTPGYFKDGYSHTYTLEIKVPEPSNYFIKGWFYGSESIPDMSGEYLKIESISATFIPGFI
jgi:Domain of unknown function (DUF4296)